MYCDSSGLEENPQLLAAKRARRWAWAWAWVHLHFHVNAVKVCHMVILLVDHCRLMITYSRTGINRGGQYGMVLKYHMVWWYQPSKQTTQKKPPFLCLPTVVASLRVSHELPRIMHSPQVVSTVQYHHINGGIYGMGWLHTTYCSIPYYYVLVVWWSVTVWYHTSFYEGSSCPYYLFAFAFVHVTSHHPPQRRIRRIIITVSCFWLHSLSVTTVWYHTTATIPYY